jgi:hypothetical protein
MQVQKEQGIKNLSRLNSSTGHSVYDFFSCIKGRKLSFIILLQKELSVFFPSIFFSFF